MKKFAIAVLQSNRLVDGTMSHRYAFWTTATGNRSRPAILLHYEEDGLIDILSKIQLQVQISYRFSPRPAAFDQDVTKFGIAHSLDYDAEFEVVQLGTFEEMECVAIVMTDSHVRHGTCVAGNSHENTGIVAMPGYVRDGSPQSAKEARQSLRHFLDLTVSNPNCPKGVAELRLFDYVSKAFDSWKEGKSEK